MFDRESAQNFARQTHELWIEPEIAKRREAGVLPDNFTIQRCLIKVPKGKAPIVLFNDEITWLAKARRGDGQPLTPGADLFLHELQEIEMVEPPEVDGQRVAFIFIFWNGFDFQACFDFTPNHPDQEVEQKPEDWQLGKFIASYLQAIMTEKAIYVYDAMQDQLHKMGLWAAPALLPYPLSKIAKHLEDNEVAEARSTLLTYCTPSFIQQLVDKWWTVDVFVQRRKLIEEAIQAHNFRFYHLSIHALLPHTEGIITDWEYSLNSSEGSIPFRTESKTKKFRDMALGDDPTTLTYRRIVESTCTFILDGPVLKTFKKWLDDLDFAFPNRHVMGHGRYDEALYTEENSIKVFLLLDTIYHIIAANTTEDVSA
jgi:hypothetical protein